MKTAAAEHIFASSDGTLVTIRALLPSDSLAEITALLHRSYRPLAAAGLNYSATSQDVETTRGRMKNGICIVGTVDERIIATLTLYRPGHDACAWYARPDVAVFGQFAVDPEFQRKGIGSHLIHLAEQLAPSLGAVELALDTAEDATQLIKSYEKRGYRFVEFARWQGKTYRSVIMSKSISTAS
ncbi:MAG: GNAT family N-acetyltransferase [Candidatus Eremiobacteraeota bacterium]|nr:GNAT family N-acetyltransferase [Candidatus Eremiobacteraeota bacterium]